MKKLILATSLLLSISASAQKYFTKTGSITFTSKTPMEAIEAKNSAVACLLDSKAGALDFVVQIKSFVFDKQLMQEHFNENYMESDKFPKATFKGAISNLSSVSFEKDGDYPVTVVGKLTIHGVTKDVKQNGTISIKGGKLSMSASFAVLLSDYNIQIPGAVKDKIAKEVRIIVNASNLMKR